jgi:hypothetical protein
MKKIMITFLAFLLSGAAVASAAVQTSGCVRCHTDEAILKSLVAPPKAAAAGGGG